MPGYEHQQLVTQLHHVDTPPDGEDDFQKWLQAGAHLAFLQGNAEADELVVHASGRYTLMHAVAVKSDSLEPLDRDDLLGWSGNHLHGRAGYTVDGEDIWIERDSDDWRTRTLKDSARLVFGRIPTGFGEEGRPRYEALQEYVHLSDIHWRREERAYCRHDEHGDLVCSVSVTASTQPGGVTLVSFGREDLERYLVASDSVLVRLFEFWLVDPTRFTEWSDGDEAPVELGDDLFLRQKVDEEIAFARGVQIIRPKSTKTELLSSLLSPDNTSNIRHVEFIAHDIRHDTITKISTDPSSTTNYFDAKNNDLPFDTSPVFFNAEVLVKYKSDRDKYRVHEADRIIDCRGGWSLRYDANEAGRVHAYLYDLRALPPRERQYWLSFNESPQGGISQRSYETDFVGMWSDVSTPLEDLLAILSRWSSSGIEWWTLRGEKLPELVTTPLSDSRDDWARSFQNLANLTVAGFEELLRADGALPEDAGLESLRTVQRIRSVAAAHIPGRRAAELHQEALETHGTYAKHFQHVCGAVLKELRLIEATLS